MFEELAALFGRLVVVLTPWWPKKRVAEEANGEQERKECHEKIYAPPVFELFLKWKRRNKCSHQQKEETEDNQPRSLNGLCRRVTLPEKRVNRSSVAQSVRPDSRSLFCLDVPPDLLEIMLVFHGLPILLRMPAVLLLDQLDTPEVVEVDYAFDLLVGVDDDE